MKLFLFLLPYIFTGLIATILAVTFEKIMIFLGWTRGNTVHLIVLSLIVFTFLQLIRFPDPIAFNLLDIFFILMWTIGINRSDIMSTMQKGKWWWKSKND
ncbi:MAG TPA: hypothetical protein DHW49_04830 [Anaerolineae bacterium]|nr:hypothetical protein [Anaerolineae bacterium]